MIATRLVQCENVLDLSGVYWDQVESTVHHETEHKILRHFVQWDDDGIDLLQNLNVLTDAQNLNVEMEWRSQWQRTSMGFLSSKRSRSCILVSNIGACASHGWNIAPR